MIYCRKGVNSGTFGGEEKQFKKESGSLVVPGDGSRLAWSPTWCTELLGQDRRQAEQEKDPVQHLSSGI